MRRRLFYLDFLRVVGIIAVIFIHVAVQNWDDLTPDSPELLPLAIFEGVSRFAVPLFVMISGALFLNPERKIEVGRLWRHNILRMIGIFFGWCAIYAVADLAFGKGWPDVISDLLFGHYHMWFLVMIIGLYIVTPLIRKWTDDEKTMRYFLNLAIPVVFILNWIVPMLANWLTEATGMIEMQRLLAQYQNLHLEILGGYLTYFVMGYYLSKRTVKRKKLLYFVGIVAAVGQVMGTMLVSQNTGSVSLVMRNDFLPTVFLITMAVFVAGKQIGERIERRVETNKTAETNKTVRGVELNNNSFSDNGNWLKRLISQMASCVLGIYLVHIIVLAIVNKIGLSDIAFTPWLAVPVTVLIVFIGSWALISAAHFVFSKIRRKG